MDNLQELIDAGATSTAGSLILDNVEVGRFSDGAFVLTDEGRDVLDAISTTPTATAAPKPPAKKTPKKATKTEVVPEPEQDDSESLSDSLDDLINDE